MRDLAPPLFPPPTFGNTSTPEIATSELNSNVLVNIYWLIIKGWEGDNEETLDYAIFVYMFYTEWNTHAFLVTQLYLTLWDPGNVVHWALLSMRFFRQEYWSWLPFPPPRIRPPEIEPASLVSPARAGRFFYHRATWEAPENRENLLLAQMVEGGRRWLISRTKEWLLFSC